MLNVIHRNKRRFIDKPSTFYFNNKEQCKYNDYRMRVKAINEQIQATLHNAEFITTRSLAVASLHKFCDASELCPFKEILYSVRRGIICLNAVSWTNIHHCIKGNHKRSFISQIRLIYKLRGTCTY